MFEFLIELAKMSETMVYNFYYLNATPSIRKKTRYGFFERFNLYF